MKESGEPHRKFEFLNLDREDSSTVNTQRAQEEGNSSCFSDIGLRCWQHIQAEICYKQQKIREGAQERGGVRD